MAAQRRIATQASDTVAEGQPVGTTREDETQATRALGDAVVELSGRYAGAKARAAVAELKVEHLERRLRETLADMDRLRSGSAPTKARPGSNPGESQDAEQPSIVGRGGPWWRERQRRMRGSRSSGPSQ